MIAQLLLRGLLIPAVEHFTKTRFWSRYRQSVRFERWGRSDREAWQTRTLHLLLTQALRSPLHRLRLERARLAAEPPGEGRDRELLSRLEPVTKAELRRHFPEGVTTSREPSDWRYLATAGTTADRMTVVADFTKRDQVRSSELRARRLALNADVAVRTVEIAPNACNVVCGLAETGPATLLGYLWHAVRCRTLFTREARSELVGRFERQMVLPRTSLPPIDPAPAAQLGEVLDHHLGLIWRARPALVRAFPVYLVWLADRLRDTGRAVPGLRLVGPYGGLTSPRMAARIAAGFGAPFADVYGTSELGLVAASCGRGPGMHLFEDHFLVEVLCRGRPVAEGEVGRLVITDLVNVAMPLVRYDVGDVGRIRLGRCPCGRRTPRLEVLGRVQEVLESPAGVLPASAVADTFFADPLTTNFRLEEVGPASFEAGLVPRRADAAPDVEGWKERFAALHGGVRRLRARVVPFVRPEPSGKYRFVHPFAKGGNLL